jgi:diketogulonate reductase-like aldo/keto reductase
MAAAAPLITLNDGNSIPAVGLGVFQVPPADTEQAVSAALRASYRHTDTAAAHRNERETGRATADSDVPRDQLYVVTKLPNCEHGYDSTRNAFRHASGRHRPPWARLPPALNEFVTQRGIATGAWAPLGRGAPLTHPAITTVAEGRGRTPARVLIRWRIQLGNIVIPKSVNPTRIASNFDVFDFEPSASNSAPKWRRCPTMEPDWVRIHEPLISQVGE